MSHLCENRTARISASASQRDKNTCHTSFFMCIAISYNKSQQISREPQPVLSYLFDVILPHCLGCLRKLSSLIRTGLDRRAYQLLWLLVAYPQSQVEVSDGFRKSSQVWMPTISTDLTWAEEGRVSVRIKRGFRNEAYLRASLLRLLTTSYFLHS